jgi:putative tryptophan/tyrosine transport system substrate-binding protein
MTRMSSALFAAIAVVLLGATASPAVSAQRQKLPVVGYLSFTSPDERPTLVSAFREGLAQAGFTAGKNVLIEYRSAGGRYEQLPALAADLVKIPAAVIAATGGEAVARAARTATSEIPIVFSVSSDAVKAGLVASLNRPGANITGVSLLNYELDSKRLQILRELLPNASTIGLLVNANNPSIMATVSNINAAAAANGQKLVVLDARTEADIDATFALLHSKGVEALLVATNPFYEGLRDHIVTLARSYSVPVLYPWREYTVAGGLISYGTSFTESYRQAGFYVGRILKGEKPADLPVVQPTKFEMLVNIKTAKLLGLAVPPSILVAADEVIE